MTRWPTFPGSPRLLRTATPTERVISGNGTALLYGDGSGTFTGPDGTVQNFGDGSGTSTINGVTIQNFGDGSGNYTDGEVTIQNFGDGSGNYTDASKTVQIFGDGSGNYTTATVTIQNFGDGSGNYRRGSQPSRTSATDPAPTRSRDITIQNFGDGTAQVNGERVDAEPLPVVPTLGVFPPLGHPRSARVLRHDPHLRGRRAVRLRPQRHP